MASASVHHAKSGLHHLHEFWKLLHEVAEHASKLTIFLGAFIMLGGVILALINIVLTLINVAFETKIPLVCSITYKGSTKRKLATFGRVRQQLGEITALGLEILVVADIMETLTMGSGDYTWESLGKICLIAAVRTVLAVMLGREIAEIEEKLEEESKEEAKEKAHHKIEKETKEE